MTFIPLSPAPTRHRPATQPPRTTCTAIFCVGMGGGKLFVKTPGGCNFLVNLGINTTLYTIRFLFKLENFLEQNICEGTSRVQATKGDNFSIFVEPKSDIP